MKIGELFVQLGVKADTFTVKDFARAIGEIPLSVATAVTSLTGLSVGFVELTKHTLDIANNLGIFRAETGLSTRDLQRWQVVAKQVGVSTDAVQSSILGITQAMTAFRTGHPDIGFAQAMGQLGVNWNGKNAFQILEQVMKNPRGLNAATMTDLIGRAHISPEMMRIFGLGSGKFGQMASVGPTMNENDIRAMADFQAALGRFTVVIEKSFVPALTAVEPYMKDLAEVMGDLVVMAGKGAGGILHVMQLLGSSDKRMDDWITSGTSKSFEEWKRTIASNVSTNVVQNIHSNADPEEVAEIAHGKMKREHDRAMKQFNNTGH